MNAKFCLGALRLPTSWLRAAVVVTPGRAVNGPGNVRRFYSRFLIGFSDEEQVYANLTQLDRGAKFEHDSFMTKEKIMLGQKVALSIAVAAAACLWAGSASANYAVKTVTACGKGGTGCMSTQVRRTAMGDQYRGPNGQWRYCQGDCRDTIRRSYLEFWLRHGG